MSADPFSGAGDRYREHSSLLRGQIRHELVAEQAAAHLAPPPGRVLDVGGGGGEQALRLARAGYQVTILDLSESMLDAARARLAEEPPAVRHRVTTVSGPGERAAEIAGEGAFAAVLCHGVLLYVDEPAPLVRALVSCCEAGGVVSLLAKNAAALAMRPGLEGRYGDALAAFGSDRETGRLGRPTRAHRLDELERLLESAGAGTIAWYGVRVFTDHLGDAPAGDDFETILRCESVAGRTDPYRGVARLIHVVARRSPSP